MRHEQAGDPGTSRDRDPVRRVRFDPPDPEPHYTRDRCIPSFPQIPPPRTRGRPQELRLQSSPPVSKRPEQMPNLPRVNSPTQVTHPFRVIANAFNDELLGRATRGRKLFKV